MLNATNYVSAILIIINTFEVIIIVIKVSVTMMYELILLGMTL